MKKPYKIVSGASTPNSRELADWLAKDGQLLIPLVELLEKGERAIDEVIGTLYSGSPAKHLQTVPPTSRQPRCRTPNVRC